MTGEGPAAVLFDLYDTLVHSDWNLQAAFVAGHLGLDVATVVGAYDDLRDERDAGVLSDPVSVLLAVMEVTGIEPDPERAAHLADLEADLLADHVGVYEDTFPTLAYLRSEGIKTAIVSNCSPTTRPVVDRLGFEEAADMVVLSCEVAASKPAAAIYNVALEGVGVTSDRSVFVDDRRDYLDGASHLGMSTYRIVRPDSHGEDAPGGHHPVVTDLAELLDRIL